LKSAAPAQASPTIKGVKPSTASVLAQDKTNQTIFERLNARMNSDLWFSGLRHLQRNALLLSVSHVCHVGRNRRAVANLN
jgi:hypothetical protein